MAPHPCCVFCLNRRLPHAPSWTISARARRDDSKARHAPPVRSCSAAHTPGTRLPISLLLNVFSTSPRCPHLSLNRTPHPAQTNPCCASSSRSRCLGCMTALVLAPISPPSSSRSQAHIKPWSPQPWTPHLLCQTRGRRPTLTVT
jgi:hypothetical protein